MDFVLGGDATAASATAATGAAVLHAASAIPRSALDVAVGDSESLVPMPDLFTRIRPIVCATDGSPRLLVRVGPYMALWVMVASSVVTIELAWSHDGFGVVDVVLSAGWWVVFAFCGFFPRLLHNVLQPGSGPLAQLCQRRTSDEAMSLTGNPVMDEPEGSDGDIDEEPRKNTDAENSRSAAVLVHADQEASLRRWRVVLGGISVLPALYGLNLLVSATVLLIPLAFGLVNPDKIFGEDNTGTWHVLIIERGKVCVFIFPFVGMLLMQAPVAFAYYLSHRVAVTLAQNEVGRLAVNVRPRAVIDDQTWSEDLARPALRLATHTVPALSAWGGGTVVVFVAAILFSTLHFILMVHNIYAPLELKVMNDWDREDGEYNPLVNFIPCLAAATLPILLSQDVAHVSTMCKVIVNSMNALRMSWTSVENAQEVHNRTYPLLYTLNSMNFNQGPGFCIFGRVIDTKSVNLLFASMISFLFTALSVLIGLGTTHWDHRLQGTGDAEAQCARLTSSQVAGLEAWQLMMNTTCTYNLTIGPSGVNLLV